jgi:hypothetical protein
MYHLVPTPESFGDPNRSLIKAGGERPTLTGMDQHRTEMRLEIANDILIEATHSDE